jgi:hypothetical protein
MQLFEDQLKGGHPNSLGNTVQVVEEVLADNNRFQELFDCYFSDDEVVRLRTSNAMKRIAKAKKSILVPYIGRFLTEVSAISQASTQWTLAQLFDLLEEHLGKEQKEQAMAIMKHNLNNHSDWIVLSQTMVTLTNWAKSDAEFKTWLIPLLQKHAADRRKSVSGRAKKSIITLTE